MFEQPPVDVRNPSMRGLCERGIRPRKGEDRYNNTVVATDGADHIFLLSGTLNVVSMLLSSYCARSGFTMQIGWPFLWVGGRHYFMYVYRGIILPSLHTLYLI